MLGDPHVGGQTTFACNQTVGPDRLGSRSEGRQIGRARPVPGFGRAKPGAQPTTSVQQGPQKDQRTEAETEESERQPRRTSQPSARRATVSMGGMAPDLKGRGDGKNLCDDGPSRRTRHRATRRAPSATRRAHQLGTSRRRPCCEAAHGAARVGGHRRRRRGACVVTSSIPGFAVLAAAPADATYSESPTARNARPFGNPPATSAAPEAPESRYEPPNAPRPGRVSNRALPRGRSAGRVHPGRPDGRIPSEGNFRPSSID